MFQPCCLVFGEKVGDFYIAATTIMGNGNSYPLMSMHVLRGVLLEVYPHAEGITWEVFHEKGYRSGDLVIFAEKQLSHIARTLLPEVKACELDWCFSIPGVTKALKSARPVIYLTIGHQDYVLGGKLKAPFEVAGDNTQKHDHSVYPPKPPRALPRDRKECEHND